MMVERRHLHHDGPFQAAEDFEREFRAVMPAGVFAADHMGAVQTVQIDEIEAAFVHRRGDFVRDFRKQRRLAVGHETTPALLQMIDGRSRHVGGRLRAARAAFAFQHGVRRVRLDGRVFDELVVDLQRHATADVVVDSRRQIRRILHQRDVRHVGRQIAGQRVSPFFCESWIGNWRDPCAVLRDGKRHRVQAADDARVIEPFHKLADVFIAVREDVRPRAVAAVVQRAVEFDRLQTETMAQVDPFVRILRRGGVHDVRIRRQLAVQRPWAAVRRMRHAQRRADHRLQRLAHLRETARHKPRLRAFETEPLVRRRPQKRLRPRQILHIRLQPQRDGRRRKRLVRDVLQIRRNVDEIQFIDIAFHGHDREHDVVLFNSHTNPRRRDILAKCVFENAVGEFRGRRVRPPAVLADVGRRRNRHGDQMVLRRRDIVKSCIRAVIVDAPFEMAVFDANRHVFLPYYYPSFSCFVKKIFISL